MKTWYRAICDEHGEAIRVFVANPTCTGAYLGVYDAEIQAWLEKHSQCKLRLSHSDADLDELWRQGYKPIDTPAKGDDTTLRQTFLPRLDAPISEPPKPRPNEGKYGWPSSSELEKDWAEMWDDPTREHPRMKRCVMLEVAAGLLEARGGEIGYALANILTHIMVKAMEIDRRLRG
jgi:hypothetical protein